MRVIITGASGMVGEGVLHECLFHSQIDAVLVIGRKPAGVSHPKLKEIIHADFFNLSAIEEQLRGYEACYFCLGVSSVGMKEETYSLLTYRLTLHVAETLCRLNDSMTFCYVSGRGTDSTEKGRIMWARIKGKTENDLFKLQFKQVFAFRPGYMHPTKGLKNTLTAYKYMSWLYPFFVLLTPQSVSTLRDLGLAMINVAINGYSKRIVEVKDIKTLARDL